MAGSETRTGEAGRLSSRQRSMVTLDRAPGSALELAGSQLAHELRETLGRVGRRLRADPGPAVGRLAVLNRLEDDGPSSTNDLAARVRMRRQALAQTVNELQTVGLVSRRLDATDGRRARIALTPAGHNLVYSARVRRETWLAETLDREFDVRERALLREALALLSRIADG